MAKYHGHLTHTDGSHTPLTKEGAQALIDLVRRGKERDAALMPEPWDATRQIIRARSRLEKLGWREGGGLKVRPGDECAVMELTSTGIWSGYYCDDGKFVMYAGDMASPRKVWMKPLADLSDVERAKMSECDAMCAATTATIGLPR